MSPNSLRGEKLRFLAGLVGESIGASRSPWLHEGEADACGLRLVYSLFDLAAPGMRSVSLPELLEAAKRTGFAGLNVTHPYKQQIIPHLDELSDEARRIGAVNTVAFRDGRSIGYNTDYIGFSESLRRGLAGAQFESVVQLGAGGGGAATAHALLEHGTGTLRVYDLQQDRLETLVAGLRSSFGAGRVEPVKDLQAALNNADGVVNATPVGMIGHEGVPLPLESLRPSMWVADIIYFPLETRLLMEARARGCRNVDGVTMVVFQAAAAFDIFTGLTADRERMLSAAINHWKS